MLSTQSQTQVKVEKTIILLAGDGIGPEIMNETKKILDLLPEYGYSIKYQEKLIGGISIDQNGKNITF